MVFYPHFRYISFFAFYQVYHSSHEGNRIKMSYHDRKAYPMIKNSTFTSLVFSFRAAQVVYFP
jgi:hypothetical protein